MGGIPDRDEPSDLGDPEEHYLRRELYELVRTDPEIFDFLQAGSLDGLWYWDVLDPGQEWMSPRFKELFGYADHEVPDESSWWMEHIFPEDLPIALENFERHQRDPHHPYDQVVRYRHRDGSTVWVRCRGIAVRDDAGRAIRLLGCHTDITALKEAELALERRNAELAEALQAVRDANRDLERFAGSVAHDLRQPLTTASGYAHLLRDRIPASAGVADLADRLVANLERASTMISDLLSFAIDAESEARAEAPVDLRESLGWVEDALDSLTTATGATITSDPLPAVTSHPAAIRQFLLNVVENAIKYRHPERPPTVQVSAAVDDGQVTLTVSDNGLGIPADQRQRVLEFGARVDHETRPDATASTGVGLATCAAIAKRLHGRITIEDGPEGLGTTVRLTLPT